VRDAQDQELRLGAPQHATRHQGAGEQQPAPEQAPVPGERGEDVGRLAARDCAGGPREQGVQAADVGSVARRDPRGRT
jgi:hypothetical protein